jgi:hypothetical protein
MLTGPGFFACTVLLVCLETYLLATVGKGS